jgi:prepilin peptidase CpaA
MYFTGFIVVFMLLVVSWDLLYRRIPNAITVTGVVAGLTFHAMTHSLASALIGAGAGFVVGFVLFYVSAVGAGDLKLLVAMGALLGFELWLPAMVATILAAGAIGLVQAIASRKLMGTLRNMGKLAMHIARFGLTPHPELNVRNKALIHSPFGVAAGIGVLMTVLR